MSEKPKCILCEAGNQWKRFEYEISPPKAYLPQPIRIYEVGNKLTYLCDFHARYGDRTEIRRLLYPVRRRGKSRRCWIKYYIHKLGLLIKRISERIEEYDQARDRGNDKEV